MLFTNSTRVGKCCSPSARRAWPEITRRRNFSTGPMAWRLRPMATSMFPTATKSLPGNSRRSGRPDSRQHTTRTPRPGRRETEPAHRQADRRHRTEDPHEVAASSSWNQSDAGQRHRRTRERDSDAAVTVIAWLGVKRNGVSIFHFFGSMIFFNGGLKKYFSGEPDSLTLDQFRGAGTLKYREFIVASGISEYTVCLNKPLLSARAPLLMFSFADLSVIWQP